TLEKFSEIQIVEFGEKEIEQFVRNWFEDDDHAKGRDLMAKIAHDSHLRELASTPLLLSLLCILFKNDLRIPKNKSELYSRCVECLLREWDSSRGFRRETAFERLSDSRKIQLFSKVAIYFFFKNKLFFSEKELIAQISDFLSSLDITES